MSIPGVNHASGGLFGTAVSTHSNEELSSPATGEDSPESDEETVCSEGESLSILLYC